MESRSLERVCRNGDPEAIGEEVEGRPSTSLITLTLEL